MKDATARRLAKAVFAFILLEIAVGATFEILGAVQGRGRSDPGEFVYLAIFLSFPIIGLLVTTRQPHNALGWVMLGMGVAGFEPISGIGEYALRSGIASGKWAIAATGWTWIPTVGFAGTFVLLLFPDGHLPSPRWRWFAWTIAIGMTVAALWIVFTPGTLAESGYPHIQNPYGLEPVKSLIAGGVIAIATLPLGMLGSAWSLVARYRRSGPTEQLQIKWLASAAAIVAVFYTITIAASALSGAGGWATDGGWIGILQVIVVSLFALIPISIGIALLKYRLYDIDLVVRKAVVVAGIVAFFTVVYVAVVGGIGALVQSRSTTALSFVAAAIVALLFQPVLRRSRRIADRIVYGKRATPYEVLSEFSEHLGGTYASEDVLPRMARVAAEGVGARSAQVWLERDGMLRVAASWPDGGGSEPVAIPGRGLPPLPGADAVFAVEDNEELLGALAVAMPPTDPMDEAKAKLVSNLAAQAGLVLRNVRLIEELRASRQRLVAAQDEERRKIERNLHDGAQQQLIALGIKVKLAHSLAEKDPPKTAEMLTGVQQELQESVETLRDLARGIYPPLLADQGLKAALEAQARKSAAPVTVSANGIGRYSQATEAAAYFCCLEALQNVAKYANATSATVSLTAESGDLMFSVIDDGTGFDASQTTYGTGLQGMADRLEAIGGSLSVGSQPGHGTTVTGRIPT